ncbi:MAG: tRNA pseudouridine(38-40) synthase TruA [Bacilli bacterium]|nr:tRNA pseudouridine(38-40) synthase TruA [Bacilli bacterium]
MRYLATVSYDGTNYVGWQIQPNGLSIEEVIEKVLSKMLNTPTKIYGSGRTDAGVHAKGQTFHFDSKEISDLGKFMYSMNKLLPIDIKISQIKAVKDDFHARFNAISKIYVYKINTGKFDVFQKEHIYQFLQKLNVSQMIEASKLFVGEHNFMNFTSKEEDESNFIRNIYSIDINEDKEIVSFTLSGNGFMRYMVRMIVGTLVQVGLGKLTVNDVKLLINSKERKQTQYKIEACGLYLEKVNYQ